MWSDLYPEDIWALERLLSYYLYTSNEIDKAISSAQRILEIDPSQYVYLQVLGRMYKQSGNYEQALKYYRQYAGYFPEDVESFSAIGNVYKNMGDFDKAKEFYDKALLLEPSNSETIISLADLDAQKGHFLEAERQFDVDGNKRTLVTYINELH